jgi:hypothetical protein
LLAIVWSTNWQLSISSRDAMSGRAKKTGSRLMLRSKTWGNEMVEGGCQQNQERALGMSTGCQLLVSIGTLHILVCTSRYGGHGHGAQGDLAAVDVPRRKSNKRHGDHVYWSSGLRNI